jgi:hypothetical protein
MAYCEIRFLGQEFDGAEDNLGSLTGKLQHAANMEALNKFGESYRRDPTDMQILPVGTLDGPKFMVQSFHSTESSQGLQAILQPHDFSFQLSQEQNITYLRTDSEIAYPLSVREYFVLVNLSKIATAQSVDIISTD